MENTSPAQLWECLISFLRSIMLLWLIFFFWKLKLGQSVERWNWNVSVLRLLPWLWLWRGGCCLGAWVRDCRLHLEVTDVPIKLSSALLLQSLLFFYSWSYEYNGSIMLPCILSYITGAGMDTKGCTFPIWDLEVKHSNSPWPKFKGIIVQKAAFFTS